MAVVVCPGDILVRTHLVQPLTQRQAVSIASQDHGSIAVVVRLADALARAHLVHYSHTDREPFWQDCKILPTLKNLVK